MITTMRTANIRRGKAAEAFEWAIKVAIHAKDKCAQVTDLQVVRNIGGPINQLHWIGTYGSMADMEATYKWFDSDAEIQKLIADALARELFEVDAADHIYATVP